MRAGNILRSTAYTLVPAYARSVAALADIYLYIQCRNAYARPLEGVCEVCGGADVCQHNALFVAQLCCTKQV